MLTHQTGAIWIAGLVLALVTALVEMLTDIMDKENPNKKLKIPVQKRPTLPLPSTEDHINAVRWLITDLNKSSADLQTALELLRTAATPNVLGVAASNACIRHANAGILLLPNSRLIDTEVLQNRNVRFALTRVDLARSVLLRATQQAEEATTQVGLVLHQFAQADLVRNKATAARIVANSITESKATILAAVSAMPPPRPQTILAELVAKMAPTTTPEQKRTLILAFLAAPIASKAANVVMKTNYAKANFALISGYPGHHMDQHDMGHPDVHPEPNIAFQLDQIVAYESNRAASRSAAFNLSNLVTGQTEDTVKTAINTKILPIGTKMLCKIHIV